MRLRIVLLILAIGVILLGSCAAPSAPPTPAETLPPTPELTPAPTPTETLPPTPEPTPASTPIPTPTPVSPATPPATPVTGYELFWDGERVGHELDWDRGQAIDNFRLNTEDYPNKEVTALFNGQSLSYLQSVKVLPVFFVPADEKEPTNKEIQLLLDHLLIAQERYKVMMKNRDTFRISPDSPAIYKSPNNLLFFRNSDDRGALKYTIELLQHLNLNRYNCPYVLMIIVMNSYDDYPGGGGRPLNGGVNRGGGIMIASSFLLNRSDQSGDREFQSTLQHELGHSFGLVHTDVYGYDLPTGDSIMSYNLKQQWKGFKRPSTEGILIPEDLYALSKNKLVFPNFYFDPDKDIPVGYQKKEMVILGPMDLSTEHFGYALFWDGKRVGHEPTWSSRQAIENLLGNIRQYPNKKVEGRYDIGEIIISGVGYELYYNGERVGHEPGWDYNQAISHLRANRENSPTQDVVALYNGSILP